MKLQALYITRGEALEVCLKSILHVEVCLRLRAGRFVSINIRMKNKSFYHKARAYGFALLLYNRAQRIDACAYILYTYI